MPDADLTAGTIVSLERVKAVLQRLFGPSGGMTGMTDYSILQAMQTATGRIQTWTNRLWILQPEWSKVYDAPPSSYLFIEEAQDGTLTVIAYGVELDESAEDGYLPEYNEDGTAIHCLQRIVGGNAVRWDYGQSAYRRKLEVSGTAGFGDVPPAVQTAALMLSVREWQRKNEQWARNLGGADSGFDATTGNDSDIIIMVKPWTRFENFQVQHTGTD